MENDKLNIDENNVNKTTDNNSSGDYLWVKFFEEMANKLLDYKENHEGLIKVVREASEKVEIKNPLLFEGEEIKDLDPFTFFSTINRNITKKQDVLKEYKESMGIDAEIPQKTNGVPERQNQKLWFTDSEPAKNDKCKSVTDLWELFESAIKLADNVDEKSKSYKEEKFIKAFDECNKKGKNIGWGATYGLFWIRPNYYVGFDGNMRRYLAKKGYTEIPNMPKDLKGNVYIKLMESIKKDIDVNKLDNKKSIVELSDYVYGLSNVTVDKIEEYINNGNLQIVLTGAPGTGKTHSAISVPEYDEFASKISGEKKYGFVQFHSSFDYSDFIEGLRPVQLTDGGNPTFVRMDGVFKSFCRRVVEESYKDKYGDDIRNKSEQTYQDFYNEYKNLEKENSNKNYYFIIDEINRADLSKVFGELMFCLEYRGIENKVTTRYSNLKTYEMGTDGIAKPLELDCFEKGFFIPNNVIIIGTMNDIDRSVESFDFALRRRFKWYEVKMDDLLIEEILSNIFDGDKKRDNHVKEIKDNLKRLNKYIVNNEYIQFPESYQIGPAYFKGYDEKDGVKFDTKIKNTYNYEIEPILKEYLRGRDQETICEFLEGAKKEFFGKGGSNKTTENDHTNDENESTEMEIN